MRRIISLLAGACLLVVPGAEAGGANGEDVSAHAVWGYWYTPDRDSVVRISDCGDGTPCGVVAWVDPVRGQVTTDDHNQDEALRGRPIEGITLLKGFETGPDGWRRGEIYHPGNGNTYRAMIRRIDENTLEVKGCVGPICKGQLWPSGATWVADAAD